MKRTKAFSCFFDLGIDVDLMLTDVILPRIQHEVRHLNLGMVIVVFDEGEDEDTIETVKQRIFECVRSITQDKFEVGVVKDMTRQEYMLRLRKYNIPAMEIYQKLF